MKKIRIRFQQDPEEQNIDVLVRSRERDEAVEDFLERISGNRLDRFPVIAPEGTQVNLDPGEIVLVSMRKNQARVETLAGSYTVRQTLQTIEQALEGFGFLRISRSELVNVNKIVKMDFTANRELRLELVGGMETWVSRRYIPLIREQISRKEESVWSGKF